MESSVRVPKQKRGIQTKDSILEAAMKLFAQRGLHGVNSKEIAYAAGVSTGTFYSYYPDKEAALLDAILYYFRGFNELVDAHVEVISKCYDDRRTVVSGLIMSLIEAHGVNHGFHEMIRGLGATVPDVRALVAEQDSKNEVRVRSILASSSSWAGEDDLAAASVVLAAAVQGAVDRIAAIDGDRRNLVASLVDLVLRFAYPEG